MDWNSKRLQKSSKLFLLVIFTSNLLSGCNAGVAPISNTSADPWQNISVSVPENITFANENGIQVTNISTKVFERWAEIHLTHSFGYTLLVIFGYLVVFVVGITGNMLVVLINILKPHIRTVKNLFILNLAVADLILLTLCVIPTLLANILRSWVMGAFMCSAVTYVQGVSVIASAYSLVALSFDRCKAITQKGLSRRGFSKTQALILILVIWLSALIVPLPWALVFELSHSQSDGNIYCYENWGNPLIGHIYFFLANLFLCYLLPLILISIANLIIWYKVANRPAPVQETFILSATISQVKEMHTKTKRGVGKMLGTVTLTFLISWLPLWLAATRWELTWVWAMGPQEIKLLGALVPPAQWLAYWNSCINPVFYAFFNAQFRQLFKSLLPKWFSNCCCRCGNAVGDDRNRLVATFS